MCDNPKLLSLEILSEWDSDIPDLQRINAMLGHLHEIDSHKAKVLEIQIRKEGYRYVK